MTKRRNVNLSERRLAVDVEIIQRRAYEIYESRGRGDGAALDDWLQAEHELLDEVRRQPVPAEARLGQALPSRSLRTSLQRSHDSRIG